MGAHGVDSDGIDCAIHADPSGHFPNRRHGMLLVEVDHLRALRASHFKTRWNRVNREYPSRAEKLRARDRELPDRSASEDGHRIAGFHLCELRSEVRRREDVGEQDRFVVRYRIGQLDQPDIGVGHASLFCLQSLKSSGRFRSTKKRRAHSGRIRVVALSIIAGAAIDTSPASDRRWDHHAIAFLQIARVLPGLFDDSDTFVAENGTAFHPWNRTPDQMQVRAADRAGSQAHNRVRRFANLWLSDFFQANIAHAVKDNGSHEGKMLHCDRCFWGCFQDRAWKTTIAGVERRLSTIMTERARFASDLWSGGGGWGSGRQFEGKICAPEVRGGNTRP